MATVPQPMPDPEFISSIKTAFLGETELHFWANGGLSLERYSDEGQEDIIDLTNSEARRLRKLLNKPQAKQHLRIVQETPGQQRDVCDVRIIDLGQHQIELDSLNKTVVIGNQAQGFVELDAHDTYRLFVALRELFVPQKGGAA